MNLLQSYATWLLDPRSNVPINLAACNPILQRLPLSASGSVLLTGAVFIDKRKEDALLAVASITRRVYLRELWALQLAYLRVYPNWKCLGEQKNLAGTMLEALLATKANDSEQMVFEFLSEARNDVSARSCELLEIFFARLTDQYDGLNGVIMELLRQDIDVKVRIAAVNKLRPCSESVEIIYELLSIAQGIQEKQIRTRSDPSTAAVEYFVSVIAACMRLYDRARTADDLQAFPRAFISSMHRFSSPLVYGRLLTSITEWTALVITADQARTMLLEQLPPVIHEVAKIHQQGYEQPARQYGVLIGKLLNACAELSDYEELLEAVKRMISLPPSPSPSDTMTDGLHLACPMALPILGAVCSLVPVLSAHCFAVVTRSFQMGNYGARSRLFYQQMIAIATTSPGSTHLNATLDILCRRYVEMEGLDGGSAALAEAFEEMVNSCSGNPLKTELVCLSLLGLFVQKGIQLCGGTLGANVLPQPPAALLELLLPAVANSMLLLQNQVNSISRQAYVELVQEFWFVLLFHGFQSAWPDTWVFHINTISLFTPVLIKERSKSEGNSQIAQVMLNQSLKASSVSYLSKLLVGTKVGQLSTAQCLWLLSFHESESLRILTTNNFATLTAYLTDDLVTNLGLSDLVNELSIGIIKRWIQRKSQPELMIDLVVSMVGLLGSVYERIHETGMSMLRFILGQDERLMAFEPVWNAFWDKLVKLSAKKQHEPGCRATLAISTCTAAYTVKVFEDVQSFFRGVSSSAVRLSPDLWHEWVFSRVSTANDPKPDADLDGLLDDVLRSLLLDRLQPRRSQEGPSLDPTRALAHHLDWALRKEALNLTQLVDQVREGGELKEAIELALGDLKNCLLLTDCWSLIIRRDSKKLYLIIAELNDYLSLKYTGRPIDNRHVFSQKFSMGPSLDRPIDPLPVEPLSLCNIVSFLSVQLSIQSFLSPKTAPLFSLISRTLFQVALRWPRGPGRKLVFYASADFGIQVLNSLQHDRLYDSDRAETQQSQAFKTDLFAFLKCYYEGTVDWRIESQRVLQRQVDYIESILSGLNRQMVTASGKRRYTDIVQVFIAFLRHDLHCCQTLLNRQASLPGMDVRRLVKIAGSVSIPLMIGLDGRLGRGAGCKDELQTQKRSIFTSHTEIVVEAILQNGLAIDSDTLIYLPPCPPLTALAIFRLYDKAPSWLNYAMRSLESYPPSLLLFYAPQITQAVRRDHLGYIRTTILQIARTDSKLAHQLIWNMQANMYIDDLGLVADPMKGKLELLVAEIVSALPDKAFYQRQFAFFTKITGISGTLKAYVKKEKWEKKAKIDEELKRIPVDPGVYLPSNPESTVVDIDYDSGRPLQSQAKAPFMATFQVRTLENEVAWQSAIFKVGDDCRQDVLALQFISIVKTVFADCGLNVYLYPYRVVATAPGCGVIEVIPRSQSRDQLGREKINSLYGYFAFKFGGDRTGKFAEARDNLIRSMAAYSMVCYLLAIRDRHNGNIMIDEDGHLIHIDFGFILDLAPGGIKFESAPFKFTSEMLQVVGGKESGWFAWFQELCVQAFLVCRPYGPMLARLVEQMGEAGLPCFQIGVEKAVNGLRERFAVGLSEWEAREYVEGLVYKSCENVRTVLYDSYQHNRNGIPY